MIAAAISLGGAALNAASSAPEAWEMVGTTNQKEEIGTATRKKAWPLINQGITTFNNLPADVKLGPKQKIQIDATESGKPHIELKAIKNFLKAFKEPLICLDFETINPGVPLFIGTWPYQQIPFQFSAHIIEKGKVKHIEVLSNANGDPRKEFLE